MHENDWYGEMPMWNGNQVHLDVYSNDHAPAKIILIHGVGGNGRVLSFIGAPLYSMGYEVIAPDLPGATPSML